MSRPKTPSPTTTARLPAMITRCGRNRSANTPLISENTSIGAVWAAITQERSAVEPVTLSTANETPMRENPWENGASSRSTSKSRKSRMASTGYRRAQPETGALSQDMTKSFADGGGAVERMLQRRDQAKSFCVGDDPEAGATPPLALVLLRRARGQRRLRGGARCWPGAG